MDRIAGFGSDDIELLLAEVRLLSRGIQEANAQNSAGRAAENFERVANRMLVHLETLPDRIAAAISGALAKQHRLIIQDVHTALNEVTGHLQPSNAPPTTET